MNEDDIARLVARRMLGCDANESDIAMRFFVERVLGIARGMTYTEEQIARLVKQHLKAALT